MMSISVYLKSGKNLEGIVKEIRTQPGFLIYFDERTKSAITIPESSIEFFECQDLEDLKRNYIPRTDVTKFKAHIIEYHTDEEGRYYKNAYIHVEELVKLINKMLLNGDSEK